MAQLLSRAKLHYNMQWHFLFKYQDNAMVFISRQTASYLCEKRSRKEQEVLNEQQHNSEEK